MRGWQPLQKLLEAGADSSAPLAAARLHAHLLRSGHLHSSHHLTSHVLASYPPALARHLFDEIPAPTPRLANALLRARVRAGHWRDVLLLLPRLRVRPDAFTLPLLLKSCAMLPSLAHGRAVHALAVRSCAAYTDAFVAAALVQMYAKCGDMVGSINAFNSFEEPDIVLRTSVVTGYEQNGMAREALEFVASSVIGQGSVPSPVTLVSVISAVAQLRDVRNGQACHAYVLRNDLGYDLFLVNAILGLYMRIGAVQSARRLFEGMMERDVVTWSCMVTGYVQSGYTSEALGVYKKMVEAGVKPNAVTVVSVLQACSLSLDVEEGKRVHDSAVKMGCELEMTVATALVDMYMKCSCHVDAMQLFLRMPKKDAVAWAAVISGLTQNGLPDESMRVFKCMLLDGPVPDAVTMVKRFVAAALVDLYSKCGNLGSAVRVFESAAEKDIVLWSSMISGYGVHGLGQHAVALYQRMVASSVKPNSLTFVSVLSACSHSGLVQEGKSIFKSMTRVYGIMPNTEHRSAMVDLLGRAGELQEAAKLLHETGGRADAHTWCALLAACREHCDTEMSDVVAAELLKLDPDHVGYYNLLTNIYAFDQKWDSVNETKDIIRDRGLKKVPGCSAVEIDNAIHTFTAGERSHQDWEKISTLLWELSRKLRGDDCFFQLDSHLVFEDFVSSLS
ncbi:putative pentatricopeptide repeat-containing protein At3g01580 isoform X2 [Hordeum vulgare subsp. vulgare]|uniref:putative pentatricopeptide repeat-containing protein At3g01580 isoform X2 n=1 Tax=Hordeum vulgare subsp. vulgare TaxID=112509 RepID=UPI000294AF02|nr:putative pentatricopeptide repeat-containing protein At3g01580 isoform X2 [Hordeum vulgare subsp. vulgare]